MAKIAIGWAVTLAVLAISASGFAWHDETHLAIAKAAGYAKWYNAAGADMAKLKAGNSEKRNHHVANSSATVVSAQTVIDQVGRYDSALDLKGHLYGAIVAAIRRYRDTDMSGKYAEYHLAFCAHYVGDLSQPLHNTFPNAYNRRHHQQTDGIIEDEALDHLALIPVYPIDIHSEADLAREIARIANLSIQLAGRLEKEGRLLSRDEAYVQIGHSASLFKAILQWLGR
jgi:hypothetical protein